MQSAFQNLLLQVLFWKFCKDLAAICAIATLMLEGSDKICQTAATKGRGRFLEALKCLKNQHAI
jgi:hypothetical protein